MSLMTEIRSLCTAQPGWYAIYQNEDGTEKACAVCAWGVQRDELGKGEEFDSVVGYDAGDEGWLGDSCDSQSNFLRYEYMPWHVPGPPREED